MDSWLWMIVIIRFFWGAKSGRHPFYLNWFFLQTFASFDILEWGREELTRSTSSTVFSILLKACDNHQYFIQGNPFFVQLLIGFLHFSASAKKNREWIHMIAVCPDQHVSIITFPFFAGKRCVRRGLILSDQRGAECVCVCWMRKRRGGEQDIPSQLKFLRLWEEESRWGGGRPFRTA